MSQLNHCNDGGVQHFPQQTLPTCETTLLDKLDNKHKHFLFFLEFLGFFPDGREPREVQGHWNGNRRGEFIHDTPIVSKLLE